MIGQEAGASAWLLDGVVEEAPNPDYPFGEWTQITTNFTVDADQDVFLWFSAWGGSYFDGCGNCGALLDNVSISAVPLPAGGALLITALGAFGVMRRRSKAKTA